MKQIPKPLSIIDFKLQMKLIYKGWRAMLELTFFFRFHKMNILIIFQ